MDCNYCQDLFSEYRDQELDQQLIPVIESHLIDCPECAKEYQYFDDSVNWFRQAYYFRAPDDILAGIQARLAEKTNPISRFMGWLQNVDFSMSLGAAAGTVAAALIIMLVAKSITTIEPTQQANTPQSPTPQIAKEKNLPPSQPTQLVTNTHRNPSSASQFIQQHIEEIYSTVLHDNLHYEKEAALNLVSKRNMKTGMANHSTAYESYLDNLSTSDSFSTGILPPDIFITLSNIKTKDRINLTRRILNNQNWDAWMFGTNTLFVLLEPGRLDDFHNALRAEPNSVFPPNAKLSGFGSPKKYLSVAVRIQ